MAIQPRTTVDGLDGSKKKAKVIEFRRYPSVRTEAVAHCSACKAQFPGGYNFNFCPDCGRALTLRQQ
jgi:rRNA maturation endonuclease Nob1